MKRHFYFWIFFAITSCTNDRTLDLSGGYYLMIEGTGANFIANQSAKTKTREIPSDVISYSFDDQFIIAKQKPTPIDNVIFTPTVYKDGRDKIYYWLIVHHKKLVLGPLSEEAFNHVRKKYKVPDELKWIYLR